MKKGANLRVCQEVVNWCPYCGGTKLIRHYFKIAPPDTHHPVLCNDCSKIFIVCCEE